MSELEQKVKEFVMRKQSGNFSREYDLQVLSLTETDKFDTLPRRPDEIPDEAEKRAWSCEVGFSSDEEDVEGDKIVYVYRLPSITGNRKVLEMKEPLNNSGGYHPAYNS